MARLGDSDRVRAGQQVLVIGAPYGLSHSFSAGWISDAMARPCDGQGPAFDLGPLRIQSAVADDVERSPAVGIVRGRQRLKVEADGIDEDLGHGAAVDVHLLIPPAAPLAGADVAVTNHVTRRPLRDALGRSAAHWCLICLQEL